MDFKGKNLLTVIITLNIMKNRCVDEACPEMAIDRLKENR